VRATLESALTHWRTSLSPSLHHDLEVMQGEVLRLQRLIDDLYAPADEPRRAGLGLALVKELT
jgi:hypothetical protein